MSFPFILPWEPGAVPRSRHRPGSGRMTDWTARAAPARPASGGAREILRPVRSRLLVSLVLVLVSTAASIVPLVDIVELARTLLPRLTGRPAAAGHAWTVVWVGQV